MIWYESFIFIGLTVLIGFIWLIGSISTEPDIFAEGSKDLSTIPLGKAIVRTPKEHGGLKKIKASPQQFEEEAPTIEAPTLAISYERTPHEKDIRPTEETSPVSPVYEDVHGNKLYLEDLRSEKGAWVNYETFYNVDIPDHAQNLLKEAQAMSQKSRYGDAMENLREAARLAPEWPYPYYERARIFLKMDNPMSAFEAYKKTDELAPRGYYETKTAVHTLGGELQNRFRPRTFYEFQKLEALEKREQKISYAQDMVGRQPHFSAAWRILANLHQEPEQRNKCILKGLTGDYDSDTYGNLLINKALLLNLDGKKREAIELLGEMIFDPNSTIGTVGMAKFGLYSMLK